MPLYYTAVSSAAMTATVDIWTQWVDGTSTATTQNVWTSWIGGAGGSIGAGQDQCAGAGQYQRAATPQEIQAAHERYVQMAAVAAERQEAINAKARELLLHYLNEKQRADLAAHHWFVVDSKSGTRYRIKRNVGMAGNIEALNPDGSVRYRLCGHDRTVGTPLDDQLLAQKFYLEHHEEEFLRIANRH